MRAVTTQLELTSLHWSCLRFASSAALQRPAVPRSELYQSIPQQKISKSVSVSGTRFTYSPITPASPRLGENSWTYRTSAEFAVPNSERTQMAAAGRSVQRIIASIKTTEGGGFKINRPFPTRALDQFDPWLMLDEMGPVEYGPGEALGAPDHPHRGFETISYLLAGSSSHKDSTGLTGSMKDGDVQWMTAGSGVVHCEMPSQEIMEKGGRVHGFQIWLNLPKRDKWIQPRYQDTRSEVIPVAETADKSVWVKVIAGESMEKKAVIETRTPILFLHFKVQPGASFTQEVPSSYNAFAYIIEGEGVFGSDGKRATAKQAVLFEKDGDSVTFKNEEKATEPLDMLMLAGTPLNEPMARYGPFVMNTEEEIQQAFMDYRAGRMGKIKHPEAVH